jgi:hypothetical protein
MRSLVSCLVACAMLAGLMVHGGELAAVPSRTPDLEVVLFEHADCVYCQVFRRDVLPKYHIAARVAAPPLRFVDIGKDDASSLNLTSRIDMVPTAVVIREGREVGRIVGYWGSASFFQLLAHILTAVN